MFDGDRCGKVPRTEQPKRPLLAKFVGELPDIGVIDITNNTPGSIVIVIGIEAARIGVAIPNKDLRQLPRWQTDPLAYFSEIVVDVLEPADLVHFDLSVTGTEEFDLRPKSLVNLEATLQ